MTVLSLLHDNYYCNIIILSVQLCVYLLYNSMCVYTYCTNVCTHFTSICVHTATACIDRPIACGLCSLSACLLLLRFITCTWSHIDLYLLCVCVLNSIDLYLLCVCVLNSIDLYLLCVCVLNNIDLYLLCVCVLNSIDLYLLCVCVLNSIAFACSTYQCLKLEIKPTVVSCRQQQVVQCNLCEPTTLGTKEELSFCLERFCMYSKYREQDLRTHPV